jgi:hypothetical protein
MVDLDLGDGEAIDLDLSRAHSGVPTSPIDVGVTVRDNDVDVTELETGGRPTDGEGSTDLFDWSSSHVPVTFTPCLCATQTIPVSFESAGIPWFRIDADVIVNWP